MCVIMFTQDPDSFTETTVSIYGRKQAVRYKCMDLLWGQKLYQKLRFVLVEYDGQKSILVSTDLTRTAVPIIELYSKRFCIENCFREMKQQTGAFCYHFWTKALEKLNHFKKKEAPDALEKVTDLKAQRRIMEKVQSIEVFVQINCIAFGILQLLAVQKSSFTSEPGFLHNRVYSGASNEVKCMIRKCTLKKHHAERQKIKEHKSLTGIFCAFRL